MKYTAPEKKGISSKNITEYIKLLENERIITHDIIIARGDDIVYENYWKPFDANFKHRMYSVSKSIVSIAVGFLEQDGKISLDDKISEFFPDEIKNQRDINMQNQTIRHMLMMSTAKPPEDWFKSGCDDRVKQYFENKISESRPSGTIFNYDSTGSFVLCAMVEKLTGKPFMEYLREKLFSKIGVSEDAYCLKCPGGYSWGDSAVICKPIDLLKIARFTLNYGTWNGEQILNENYLRMATSKLIDNSHYGNIDDDCFGYGYLIWKTYEDSFIFYGMGCQFAICVPDKDIIMIYNGDNQGFGTANKTIIQNFFKIIVDNAEDRELESVENDVNELKELSESLELFAMHGSKKSDFADSINGVTYVMDENPMGITKFCIDFDGEKGKFSYTNAQGEKEIVFGMCKNEFGLFPQDGYSDEVGTEKSDIHYKYAASAAWVEEQKLNIKVQIIDKYFGNLNIVLGFREDIVGMHMRKSAEDFLDEYQGFASGRKK